MKRKPLLNIPPNPTGCEGWNVQKWMPRHRKFLSCGPRGNRSKAEGFMLAMHEAEPYALLHLVDEQGVCWQVMSARPEHLKEHPTLYVKQEDGSFVEASAEDIRKQPLVQTMIWDSEETLPDE